MKNDGIQSVISAQIKVMKTIVFTGGGTAGHVIPNIALFDEAKKHFNKIAYIGSCGIEKELVKKQKDVAFYEIEPVKFVRALTLKNLLIPAKLIKSVKQAKKILKKIKPNVVFSKGGYVSLPTVIAAKSLHIPVVSHESDISLGLANKIIYKFSNVMLTSFEKTAEGKKKCIFVGSPVRKQIFNGNKNNLNLNFNESKKTILFFGGSLGSNAINECVFSNIESLTKQFNILHITGKGKMQKIEKFGYHCVEYTNNIEDYFAAADAVVCRGGANTLFELLALAKPMLIIPLPKSESRGDQIENAKYFYGKNYAKILFQENLNGKNLLSSLKNLLKNSESLKNNIKLQNFENVNQKIMNLIVQHTKK